MSEPTQEIVVHEGDSRPVLLRPIAGPHEIVAAHEEAVKLIEEALTRGIDFGVIPGTGDKPALLKPGAERLCLAFGVAAEFEIIEQEVDHSFINTFTAAKWVTKPKPQGWQALKEQGIGRNKKFGDRWAWQEKVEQEITATGLYRYAMRCVLKDRSAGQVVGQGVGSCSSLESKYADRPRDCENTVLKMSKKRSLVDAVLNTFGLSDRFTQDTEEIVENRRVAEPEEHSAAAAEAEQPAAPAFTDEEAREAADYAKEIAMARPQYDRLGELCQQNGMARPLVLIKAKKEGWKNLDQIISGMEWDPFDETPVQPPADDLPVDEAPAEVVEAQVVPDEPEKAPKEKAKAGAGAK